MQRFPFPCPDARESWNTREIRHGGIARPRYQGPAVKERTRSPLARLLSFIFFHLVLCNSRSSARISARSLTTLVEFDVSLCQRERERELRSFEGIPYLVLVPCPPLGLLLLPPLLFPLPANHRLRLPGNREYFEITVCIKSSRTFNGR